MSSSKNLCARREIVRHAFLALAAAAVLISASPAKADSVLTDGGFESVVGGNLYGAGQSLDGAWKAVSGLVYIDTADPYVFAGQNSLNLTYVNPYVANTVSQTLATVAGETYNVSFWANADAPNSFSLTENGVSVSGTPTSIVQNGFPSSFTNSSLFQDYTGTFTAASGSTVLSFTGTADPGIGTSGGSVMIDNVSVQGPATAVTPEPESLVLVLSGALGLGGVLRRRFALRAGY